MTKAACIIKFGWLVTKDKVFDGMLSHFDIPCFCNEMCPYYQPTSKDQACHYKWPELECDHEWTDHHYSENYCYKCGVPK